MISDALFPIAMFGLPGGVEWIVILFVALLLFGRRLPEIMRGLGGSVREFKKGLDTEDAPPAVPPTAHAPPPGSISRGETRSETRSENRSETHAHPEGHASGMHNPPHAGMHAPSSVPPNAPFQHNPPSPPAPPNGY